MSVLQRYPSYTESNKGSEERQGPTLGVRFYRGARLKEVSVKKESTVVETIYSLVTTNVTNGRHMMQFKA